jgi:molecular chaperone DnaJ
VVAAKREKPKTLYEALDMPPGTEHEMLKERYRTLVREHHPDAGGDTEFFKCITEAGSILLDPVARDFYDRRLRMTFTTCETCNGSGQTWRQQGFNNRFAHRCKRCNGRGFLQEK